MSDATAQLTQWVISKIISEYPDEVALLVAVDGASCNGDEHGLPFDYFVPATEHGKEMAQTFIIGDVGNDLYPRSWLRTERTANLDDPATQCLGNARILYSRSDADTAHFEALRQRLFDNLADTEFTYRKALENLGTAMDLYKTLMFDDQLHRARGLAGFIYKYLAVSVSYLNGTYIDDLSGGFMPMIGKWPALPEHFAEDFEAITRASSVTELRNIAHSVIARFREFIAAHKPEDTESTAQPDFNSLANWYQELKTTWERIYHHCAIADAGAAFMDACYLQNELDIVGEEFCLGELDLLGCFDHDDLAALASRASILEDAITAALDNHGVAIERYDTIDAFLDANPPQR